MFSLGIALVLVIVVVAVGRRIGAPYRVGFASIGVLAAAWVAALALEQNGWRDTDGWIDCNDHCNGWHQLGALLFWTPLLAGTVLVLVLVGGFVARVVPPIRRRRDRARG